ncbi:MAG TPA: lysylphosphatidylglycerol synthase domain-containing protein, partial [Candidatus Binataceae bacterium]|nr:lysylphosphatidylglycerol synthase domain-containing protein [Candidatus Binataceae bacterium]
AFWLGGEPRNGLARWLYQWPHMISFRDARPAHYAKLMAIRFAIYVGAGVALYAQLRSFHIEVPLIYVLALTPFVMAAGNSLISPAGIGTTQFVFTLGFAHFASREQLLAVSLAATAFNFIFRIPMGLAMGRSLVDELSVAAHGDKRTTALADSD